MKRFVTILGGLFALVGVLFGLGFVLPAQVHIERSIAINAPQSQVFALVGDFTQWQSWSPWATKDPNMTMTISGKGVGQAMQWKSDNPAVGSGSQAITALNQPNQVTTHLDFGDQGMADATLQLTPQGDGTLVTWTLDTNMREGVPTLAQPLSTYLGFFMDSMVGQDYEAGLTNLKAVVEQ